MTNRPHIIVRGLSAIKAHLLQVLLIYGFNSKIFWVSLKNTPRFVRDLRTYRKMHENSAFSSAARFPMQARNVTPFLMDYEDAAGSGKGSYFHQDIWAARKIYQRNPQTHIDVGSRIDGFIGHLLVFRDVSVIDVRDLDSAVDGLTFIKSDATDMAVFADNSIDSLSSLHAAEHFGLGRYGDPINPDACFQFMKSLQRVLQPSGRLYFSVPIGNERLLFNAQRIFDPATIVETFDQLELLSFSTVDKSGDFIADASLQNHLENRYVCGLFEFTKP